MCSSLFPPFDLITKMDVAAGLQGSGDVSGSFRFIFYLPHVSRGHAQTGGSHRNAAWSACGLHSHLGGTSPRVCGSRCPCSMEAQRYPLSVRVIGVMHKEKSKVRAPTLCPKAWELLVRVSTGILFPADVHDLRAVVGPQRCGGLQNLPGVPENARKRRARCCC